MKILKKFLKKEEELVKLITDLEAEFLNLSKEEFQNEEDATQSRANIETMEIMLKTLKKELNQVKNAIIRVNDKEYGECLECGAKISKKRLKALPYAVLCIDCANDKER